MKLIIKFILFVFFGAVFPSVLVQASSYYSLSFSINLGTIEMASSTRTEKNNISSENGLVQQADGNELDKKPHFESGETEETVPSQVNSESTENTESSTLKPDKPESTRTSTSESTMYGGISLVPTEVSGAKINDSENN